MVCVPSKVEGTEVIATQLVLFNGKSTKMRFSCFVEQILAKFVPYAIYFDEIYEIFMLSILMPRCTLTSITTTKLHILVTKMEKTLDFADFWQFRYF